MLFDIWTFLNPIFRTIVYIFALTAIGTMLFQFHFSKLFDIGLTTYCQNLLKKLSFVGLLAGSIVFLSVAGNLGGDLYSTTDISLIKLSFETLSGKSALFLIIGFLLIIASISFKNTFSNLAKFLSIILILISFVIVGHSTLKGLSTQVLILMHLFCISFWLGSFLPLRFMCIDKNSKNLSIISERFGQFAIFYISVLVITGSIFSFILVGGIDPLISTSYGNFLILKLIFVTIILSLGALNKFRLVPLIRINYEQGKKKLKQSIQFEIIITLIILFFTSILTTSLPTPIGV